MTTGFSDKVPDRKPQTGDVVAYCPHIAEPQQNFEKCVFYWCEETTYSHPSSGAKGQINWLYVCADCEQRMLAEKTTDFLSGLARFKSDPPSLDLLEFQTPKAEA